MTRKHFFESLEKENNYQHEFEKIEELCNITYYSSNCSEITINTWIELNFWDWGKRSNYTSFKELRSQIGFDLDNPPTDVDINKYFLYCEMLLNLVTDLGDERPEHALDKVIITAISTIQATLANAGFELRKIDDEYMVVEQNAVAIQVADDFPSIAEAVIEYNHYLLKGDLKRKQELLKRLADSLEPKRDEMNRYCKTMSKDFFYMANNFNIRHNNCDPKDPKHYNAKYACYDIQKKEECYDTTYEQGLALFVMIKQQERNKIIATLK